MRRQLFLNRHKTECETACRAGVCEDGLAKVEPHRYLTIINMRMDQ